MEKILEMSGKSQGNLSLEKSRNPGIIVVILERVWMKLVISNLELFIFYSTSPSEGFLLLLRNRCFPGVRV